MGPVTYGDGFAVRLDPSGARYLFSTCVGSEMVDDLLAVAVDRNDGTALAVGRTHPVFPQAGDRPDPTMTLIALPDSSSAAVGC